MDICVNKSFDMKQLKDYIIEASESSMDMSDFTNKTVIKQSLKIINSSFDGKYLSDEQTSKILSSIDKRPEFAEVIIKGKFPAATPDNRYGYCNTYDCGTDEVLFSAVKNSYDGRNRIEYEIRYWGKSYGATDKKADCKCQALMKYYKQS